MRILDKGIIVFLLRKAVLLVFVLGTLQSNSAERLPGNGERKASAAKHDGNSNGKIDRAEHKAYAIDRTKQRLAEARELAQNRPKLNRRERLFFQMPRVTPELLKRYDANADGKLDLQEKIEFQKGAGENAKKEFRRHDKNGDGKLDAAELRGAKIPSRIRSTSARPTTISPSDPVKGSSQAPQ